ncbi:hypothetical protein [Parageobacillus thermoglucosidasius]|uniref:hypothetical protein n=1 Tax=Parageobacillus thermoglucosidasius TaxID=1426 RepID=UPI000E15A97C|nr:hypothetical protein [Parageobacillus thermoglucosidasius]REK53145.1 MAG: hypothetical protein C6P36_17390 [Geobacillus sp.]MED4903577.1 hypothetical protein [Parageobacillus thermoglucosidasius]MED4913214.1 hypothetical protein [Parageobacillus thermoglucosidasius]MED4944718.1 hypothetical protein [Parageobacillus thermoglucosidasius]MED4984689.1 hypothetical protein [Parageobacillus thermoglucosidasius]
MKAMFPSSELKQKVNSHKKTKKKKFSLKRGLKFLLQGNFVILLIIFPFFINKNHWYEDSHIAIETFVIGFELLFILLFLPACYHFEPISINRVIQSITKKREKKERIGMAVAFIIISLLSLGFLGIDVPFPSTYILLWLTTNMMYAFLAVFWQRLAFLIYYANVHDKQTSIMDYLRKYAMFFFISLNHYVQQIFSKAPFLLNKLFATLFVIFLFWQCIAVIKIFNP